MQAGTGTGKSFAYLVPAALWSLGKGKRVLMSTATLALQRQLMARTCRRCRTHSQRWANGGQ